MSDEAQLPAPEEPAYLIGPHGKVVSAPMEKARQMMTLGYTPAGASQIEDFKKEQAFHAKYGTVGQQIKTGAEAAGEALTLGGSDYVERALGVNKEDIANREKENPGSHMVGTVLGVAAPLILSGGAAAPEEGVALAGEGALKQAARLTAPSLISKAGELAGEGVGELIGDAATPLGRVLTKGATAGVQGLAEGAAYGGGQVVHEAALGDPHLTASNALEEIGLSALLGGGIGAGTSILGGLVGEAANGKLGQKISEWADTSEGHQNIKTAAGPGKGQRALTWLHKKMGPEQAAALGREAGDLGLVGTFDGPQAVFEKSGEMMDDVGPKIDEGLRRMDALPDAAHPTVGDVVDHLREKALKPIDVVGADKGLVSSIKNELETIEKDLGGRDAALKFEQMNNIRRNIDKRIYGYRGNMTVSTDYKAALRDISHGFGDEIQGGIEKSGADFAPIKALNRQYSVAATINHISEGGLANAGLSGVPLTALITGAAGLIHGGPLGAAALGAGAMLAKRYGPQMLAAGARGIRGLVDEEAASALASKTAQAISAAREAAPEAGAATRAGRLWSVLGEKLETPVVAPGQDLLRDAAKDKLSGGAEGTPIETVAALSQLEAANMRAKEHINKLAAGAVHGKAGRVAMGLQSAALAHTAEKFTEHMDAIHHAATNPSLLLDHVTQQTEGLHEHAPNVAQAIATKGAAAATYLHQKFPAPPRAGPLAPAPKPTKTDLYKYNRAREVIEKPSRLLKHAANGTLTPAQVEAVAAVHPEHLAAQRQAVLNEIAESGAKVPHKQRLMLSMLLGQSLDGSTSPQALMANQAIYRLPSAKGADSQTGPAATDKSTQTGLAKLSLSHSAMLPGQAADARTRRGV